MSTALLSQDTDRHVASSPSSSPGDAFGAVDAVRDLLIDRRAEVLGILTRIGTAKAAAYEIDAAVAALEGAREELARYRPGRVGRSAVFMPSNVLLYSYVLYLVIPGLYVDSAIFRPSSQTKAEMAAIHDLLAPVHGLDVEMSTASQRAFVRDEVERAELVVFTGAYQNAEQIRHSLRREQVFAFLGSGINPVVVAPGANLPQAIHDIVDLRMLNSGQDCLAPDIIWVHRSHGEDFLRLLTHRLEALRHGPHDHETSDYSSLTYASALAGSVEFLVRHRERIRFGGSVDLADRHLRPTVLVWERHKDVEHTEFFAPVFNVCLYDDERTAADVFASGHYSERALGASVYGHAPEIVASLSKRHTLTLDTSLLSIDDGNAPFGGWGPMANYVATDGALHPEPILLSKVVADHLRTAESPRPTHA